MNVPRPWRRVFSVAIIAVMLASMVAVFPVFREAGAQQIPGLGATSATTPVSTINISTGGILIPKISVLQNNVTYVGVSGNTIYIAMPGNSNQANPAYNWSSNFTSAQPMYSNTTALELYLNSSYGIQIDAAITAGHVGMSTTNPIPGANWGQQVTGTYTKITGPVYVGIDVFYQNISGVPKTVTLTLNAINATTGISQLINVVVYVINSTAPLSISPGTKLNANNVNTINITWNQVSGADEYKVKVYYEGPYGVAPQQPKAVFTVTTNYLNYAILTKYVGLTNGTYKIYVFPYNATWNGGILFPGGSITFIVDERTPTVKVNFADLFFDNASTTTGGWYDNLTAINITVNGTLTAVQQITSSDVEILCSNGAVLPSYDYNLSIVATNGTPGSSEQVTYLIAIALSENITNPTNFTVKITIQDAAGNTYILTYGIYNLNSLPKPTVFAPVEDSLKAGEAIVTFNISAPTLAIGSKLAVSLRDSFGEEWFPVLNNASVYTSAHHEITITYSGALPGVTISFSTPTYKITDTMYAPNGYYVLSSCSATAYSSWPPTLPPSTATMYPYRIYKVNGKVFSGYPAKVEIPIGGLNYLNVTYVDFNVTVGVGATLPYSVYVAGVAYNGTIPTYAPESSGVNTTSINITDEVAPWISSAPNIYASIPTLGGYVNVLLPQGNVPKGGTVQYVFQVNDTHLWYFNATFTAAGTSVSVSVEFPDQTTYYDTGVSPTITITSTSPNLWIKNVEIVREVNATFHGYPVTSCWQIQITLQINDTAGTTLLYTWGAVDYGHNSVSGSGQSAITNNVISATNETVVSLPHGALKVNWTVSNTTRYEGFIIALENTTTGAKGLVPSPEGGYLWPASEKVIITYDEICKVLGAAYNGSTVVNITVVSNDGHYGYVYAIGVVDNETPSLYTPVGIVYPSNVVYSPVVNGYVLTLGQNFTMYLNITDKYTGVAKIVVDASSINTTGVFSKIVANVTPGKVISWNLTIVVNKAVNGSEPIKIMYYDAAGNLGVTTEYVWVDTQPPKIVYSEFPIKACAGSNVSVTINATDNPAGLTFVNVTIGSNYNSTTLSTAQSYYNATYNITLPLKAGVYPVYVTVKDLVGHIAKYEIGTIHVYPAVPAKVSIAMTSINGKPTGYTSSSYNVVYVGDKFKLVATLVDQYGNVIPSQNVKLQWKIVVENSSGSAVPIDVPAYGDYAIFKALAMGKIQFEVYLLEYVNPINGTVTQVKTPVTGQLTVYVIPGVNVVQISAAKSVLQVGTSTKVTVKTYYMDTTGKYFTQPIPAPFAKVALSASAGTLPSSVTTDKNGVATFTYYAPKYMGVASTTVVLTATSGNSGGSVKITVRAGPAVKMSVKPTTLSTVATVPVKFTVSLCDQYGNPAYGVYPVKITVVSGSSYISSVPSAITYNNGSTSFTLYTSPEAYGTIVLNITYNSTIYQVVKISVLPLPNVAKIQVPSEVGAYSKYNVTIYVYNSKYGVPTPGALVKLYEKSSVYGMKYIGEGVTNSQGLVTIQYHPSLFSQNTNVTLVAQVYVNETMVVQGTAKVLVKAYWPKVVIQKVSEPVPVSGSSIQPGKPFYVDITLKSETCLPTNITVYVSLYKSGVGIESGEWLITTAYVELGPYAEKTVRIFMVLPYNAPTGNWTMVITLHDWNRFIKYGPQGSVLPWPGSRTYIVFYVSAPSTGTGWIQATEIYWRRFD